MEGLDENRGMLQLNNSNGVNMIYSTENNGDVVVTGTAMSSIPSNHLPANQQMPQSQIQVQNQSYGMEHHNFGHHQQYQANGSNSNSFTERRRRISKPLAKLSYKEATYVAITDGFVPTWHQLLPSTSEVWRKAEQARTRKSFKLSLLNVSEFTITGLPIDYTSPPTSVQGLRTHIKHISRTHGKAVWERGSQESEGKWRIPLGAYHAFHAFLNSDPMTTVEGIPPNQLKIASIGRAHLAKDSPTVEKLVTRGVPYGLASALASFQRAGVEFVAEKDGRALIADEMGLGKTVQAIASMSMFAAEWPLLVLSPSNARYHWESEFNHWLGLSSSINEPSDKESKTKSQLQTLQNPRALLRKSQIHVLGSAKDNILPDESVRIVICSYGLVPRLITTRKIIPGLFKCVIVDESHMLKNKATKRTSTLIPVLKAADRVVLLSGTPAFARPMELWPQLTVLRTEQHGWWHDETSFFSEYVKHGSTSKRAELHTLLTGTVMIRRMKADILKSLPAKARECMLMEVSDASMKQDFQNYLQILRTGKGALGRIARKRAIDNGEGTPEATPVPASDSADAPTRKSVLNLLYCLTGRSKIQMVVKMLKLWLSDKTKGKLCIFAHHIFILDALVTEGGLSNEAGSTSRYIRIDGSTLPRQRQDQIDTFQNDPSVRIAVLGITAAGVAVTLTAASTVWFAELFWTPALMIQAEDRCHRIGQQAKVCCLYVVAKGTLDEILWELMEKKFRALGEFVEGKEKMKLVVNRTYQKESDWFDQWNEIHDDKDADADTDADPPPDLASIFHFDEVGEGIEHDIEELGRSEQLMMRSQESDDEGDADTKVLSSNSMKQMPGTFSGIPKDDGLGRTEDEAICLEDHDDDVPADEAKPENPVESAISVTNMTKRRNRPPSHLPRLRLYKMNFRGPTYGFRIKIYKGRMIIMGISADRVHQLGEHTKPNVGDIIVAINGLPIPLASSRKQLLVLFDRASKNPPTEILFGEDVGFAEHFNAELFKSELSLPATNSGNFPST